MKAVDPDEGAKRDGKVTRWLLIGLAGVGAFVAMGIPMRSPMARRTVAMKSRAGWICSRVILQATKSPC